MSKITPKRAKIVEIEHFREFKKNAEFVLSKRSQRDVAELMGMHETNLSKYLYGYRNFFISYTFINRFSSIFRNIIKLRLLSPAEKEIYLASSNEEDQDYTINEKLDSIREDLNEMRRELALLREEWQPFIINQGQILEEKPDKLWTKKSKRKPAQPTGSEESQADVPAGTSIPGGSAATTGDQIDGE
jgi:transcriptional regulator with XRE-family HTH domain